MRRHFLTLLGFISIGLLPACQSPRTTAVDGPTAVANAATVAAPLLQGSVRIAVPMVLRRNPQLAEEIGTLSAAASAILVAAAPTADSFAAALQLASPKLDAASARQFGIALESAYAAGAALLKAQTGAELKLTALLADPQYRAAADTLAAAFASGLSAGLADYRAAPPL